MLLSTTSNIDNYQIKEHYGIINHNIVIGSNLISDFMASFSDVFGGGSGTYRTKMDNMYKEMMQNLSFKAESLGANAIIGINIDFDEISGQGKQMFMLSAIGTAVKVIPSFEVRINSYKLLHDLETLYRDGIIKEDVYKYEKGNVLNWYNHVGAQAQQEIINKRIKEEEEKKQAEILAKHIKEKEERLKKYTNNNDIFINADAILSADYSESPIDESVDLIEIIKQFIELSEYENACKYYIDQTGLGIDDAIEYVSYAINSTSKDLN